MKQKITKDIIIDRAFLYADQHGLDALSMRNLASVLNVKAMSLYNHIKNKEEVVECITDKLISLVFYEESNDWKYSIKNRARSLKNVLLEHRWGVLPLMYGFHTGPWITGDFDRSIGILRTGGFTYSACNQIISSINSYVYGYVLSRINFPIEEKSYQSVAEDYKDFFSKEKLPHLWGMSNEIRMGQYNGIIDFELGLDFIIKGIETIIAEKGDLKI